MTHWYRPAKSGTFWWFDNSSSQLQELLAENALVLSYFVQKNCWWFDYSRSQGSQWQLWISKQSSICSRGAGHGNSVDPVIPVRNKNFSGNTKEFAKVLGSKLEVWSRWHWQFPGIWQVLRGIILELLCVNTTQIRNKWIAERAVRIVKEGTSAVLLQSGLDESWWADSVECYTYLRNVTDSLSDGKTPFERRFGEPFKGPIIPFVSLVEYYLISAKDQSRIHQFGKKVLPGLFLGYALYAGWNLEGWQIGCRHWGIGDDGRIGNLLEKTQPERSDISQRKWKNYFPVADGRIKFIGGDQERRTSTLIREHPSRGEGHVDFLGESEGSLSPLHDSFQDAGEAINDFWSMSGNFIYRHHSEPRVKLYSPPKLLKNIDVSRTTRTNLDVMLECGIDDNWNIDGSRDLSDSWTGFTQCTLLEEKPPDGFLWSGVKLTKRQATSRPDHYGQNSGRNWEEMRSWRRSRNGRWKNRSSIMLEDYEEFIYWPWGQGVQRNH